MEGENLAYCKKCGWLLNSHDIFYIVFPSWLQIWSFSPFFWLFPSPWWFFLCWFILLLAYLTNCLTQQKYCVWQRSCVWQCCAELWADRKDVVFVFRKLYWQSSVRATLINKTSISTTTAKPVQGKGTAGQCFPRGQGRIPEKLTFWWNLKSDPGPSMQMEPTVSNLFVSDIWH